LGLQIVGRYLRRSDQTAIFVGEGDLAATVEEVGDVRIFLGFGDAQLLQTGLGNDFAQRVLDGLGRERDRAVERRVICRHAHVVNVDRRLGVALGRYVDECPRNLARAIGPKVEEDHAVAVANAANRLSRGVIDVDRWLYELVGHVGVVTCLDGRRGARGG